MGKRIGAIVNENGVWDVYSHPSDRTKVIVGKVIGPYGKQSFSEASRSCFEHCIGEWVW